MYQEKKNSTSKRGNVVGRARDERVESPPKKNRRMVSEGTTELEEPKQTNLINL